jgi:endonuclease/exonuclease/phosphatase family metal-dependent hydrolase
VKLSKRINAQEPGASTITGFTKPYTEIVFTVSVTDDNANSTFTRDFALTPIDTGDEPSTATIRVGSFNGLYEHANEDPADPMSWVNRKVRFFQVLNYCNYDVVGMQELMRNQPNDISINCPQYNTYGGIYYKSSRFRRLDQGFFYLSETPYTPGIGWDAQQQRACNWVYLQDKATGIAFYFYCSHFDHIGAVARAESAKLVVKMMAERTAGKQAFTVGDLNSKPGSETNKTMRSAYTDVFDIAQSVSKGAGITYNDGNVSGIVGSWIDYIFMNTVNLQTVNRAEVVTMLVDGMLSSDHYPILAEVVLK